MRCFLLLIQEIRSEAAQRKRKWPFDTLSQNTGYDHKTMKREEQRTEQMMKLQKATDGLKDIKEGVYVHFQFLISVQVLSELKLVPSPQIPRNGRQHFRTTCCARKMSHSECAPVATTNFHHVTRQY